MRIYSFFLGLLLTLQCLPYYRFCLSLSSLEKLKKNVLNHLCLAFSHQVELALPETTHGMLRLLCHDASLVHSHGEVCATLLPYLRHLDPEAYENHLTGEKIVTSLRATTEFLEQWPEQVHQLSIDCSVLHTLYRDANLPPNGGNPDF